MGDDVLDDRAIAKDFSKLFANCGNCNPSVQGQPIMTARTSCQFGLKCVDEQLTLGLLKRLETHKATRMNGISSRLLKLTAPGIAGRLTHLFNCSLITGEIPSEWKSAKHHTCV